MEIKDTRAALTVANSDLSGSRYLGTRLSGTAFEDVDLHDARISNASLAGAMLSDVDLTGLTITDANVTGMTINGMLVSDLIRAAQSRCARVHDADLSESRYRGVKLAAATFDDVDLRDATFTNVTLAGACLRDVNLTGVTICDANLTGMTIDGRLVSEMTSAATGGSAIVVYARNLAMMAAFYRGVFGLGVGDSGSDYVVLASGATQLTIVQIPESIASSIHLTDPPRRRTEAAVKPVLEVASLDAARGAAAQLGGIVDDPALEWTFGRHRICNAQDPEGNVVQLRQPAVPSES